ncbi:MAG TPA: cysteine--tRNA ligase, partial [Methanotrichaceae archaeon]|nr:cysteine--tRNA ligase [Methanotrichaceae archaeon]
GDEESFSPMRENRVRIFVCGPTVYDDAHIGHARTYIAFDLIARYLSYKGYSVFYVQNITDIDDKIINRASELEIPPQVLARRFEERYLEDMLTLGVNHVNLYARATEHIDEIIDQIKRLVDKGFAYETETGVYFDESRFPDFGKLSGQSAEDLKNHRIEPDPTKRNPGDFSLWKKRDESPTWDSPWGRGRPGWHIEDTAITETYFGPQYDIHGGARDLIFPHHEAEIAQMEASSGKKPMVRYWMHTGFLNVDREKMSKSLGNFITIRDILARYDPETFRFFVLSTHYRSPIDFSEDGLDQARRSLERIHTLAHAIDEKLAGAGEDLELSVEGYGEETAEIKKRLIDSMDDDFNTPDVFSIIFDLVRDVNRRMNDVSISLKELRDVRVLLSEFGDMMGLELCKEVIKTEQEEISRDLLGLLVDVRQKLRDKKDWALSDEIRDRLRDMSISLEDRKNPASKQS